MGWSSKKESFKRKQKIHYSLIILSDKKNNKPKCRFHHGADRIGVYQNEKITKTLFDTSMQMSPSIDQKHHDSEGRYNDMYVKLDTATATTDGSISTNNNASVNDSYKCTNCSSFCSSMSSRRNQDNESSSHYKNLVGNEKAGKNGTVAYNVQSDSHTISTAISTPTTATAVSTAATVTNMSSSSNGPSTILVIAPQFLIQDGETKWINLEARSSGSLNGNSSPSLSPRTQLQEQQNESCQNIQHQPNQQSTLPPFGEFQYASKSLDLIQICNTISDLSKFYVKEHQLTSFI